MEFEEDNVELEGKITRNLKENHMDFFTRVIYLPLKELNHSGDTRLKYDFMTDSSVLDITSVICFLIIHLCLSFS
jgi:hypothetical protein